VKKDFIVDKLSRVLECIKKKLEDMEEYHETNYFTLLGELRAIEQIIELLDIDDVALELKFYRIYNLVLNLKGV